MQCNKCGMINNDTSKFCANCGNTLVTYNYVPNTNYVQNNYVPNNQVYNYNNMNYAYNNVPKKSNNGVLISICLIMIMALGAIVFIIANKNDNRVYISHDNNEITSTTSNKKNNNGQTIIEPERTYDMDVNSEVDAKKIIDKDSMDQKSKCNKKTVEVENRITKNYNITGINFCELDYNLALELEGVVKYIYTNYPTARGYLTNISVKNGTINDSYIAYFRPFFSFTNPVDGSLIVNKTTIMLNTVYFFNLNYFDQAMKGSVSSGHFPKNATTYSSVAHEFGHYLSIVSMMKQYNVDSILILDNYNYSDAYKLMKSFSSGDYSLGLIKEAYNNYISKTGSKITLDEFRSSISGYAMAKDSNGDYIYDETIAEAFHDVYLNGNSAAPASLEIVSVLGSRLR